MEIITIDDSSDDDEENAPPTAAAPPGDRLLGKGSNVGAASSSSQVKHRRRPIVTPKESQTQSITDDNDNGGLCDDGEESSSSVSSADSIWNADVGLPSTLRIKEPAGNEEVLVISDDECSSAANEVRCIPPAAAAALSSSQPTLTQTIQQPQGDANAQFDNDSSGSDSSTVSSNDSIWLETGLSSRRTRDKDNGNVSVAVLVAGESSDILVNHIVTTSNDGGNDTSRHASRLKSSREEGNHAEVDPNLKVADDECSCVSTALLHNAKQRYGTANGDDDESSISSDDSIWDKAGLPSREKAVGTPLNVLVANEYSDVSALLADAKQRKDTTKSNHDDGSTVSSDDSIWDKAGFPSKEKDANAHRKVVEGVECSSDRCIAAVSLDNAKQRQDGTNNRDENSVSSEDSIWKESGLPSREKASNYAPRVKSYYDYLRLQQARGGGSTSDKAERKANNNNHDFEIHNHKRSEDSHHDLVEDLSNTNLSSLPPEVPLPVDATWEIVLLMDHREFGCANNFLQTVETKINKYFGGNKCSEITTLPSADYLYVARLLSHETGEILDERVLDMVIERKNVADACQCLVTDSKKYKPLSFFEAQMYKLQNCGVSQKLFLMEGDEDRTKSLLTGAKSHSEKERRLKRVKTLRLQLENGEFEGVTTICTRNRMDTIKFLIRQLEIFQQSFNPMRPPTKTREQLKLYIDKQMKAPTFCEYLRLRKIPGIGDAKAMKVILDPNLHWNKSFISPSSRRKSKSTLGDRATFWRPPPSLSKCKDISNTAEDIPAKSKKGQEKTKSKNSNVTTLQTFFDCQARI